MKKIKIIEPKQVAQARKTYFPTHEAISSRAARIWEQKGRPEGRDQEIWLEAERLLARATANLEDRSDELDALFPRSPGGASTSL